MVELYVMSSFLHRLFQIAVNLVNGRCYLIAIVETIDELKAHMSSRHWEIIHLTPFVALIEIEPLLQERFLLDTLLQRYDERSQKFKIGERLLSFRVKDITIILGLRCAGDVVFFQKKKTQTVFEKEYFLKTYERHRNSTKKLQQIIYKRGAEDNSVKLLMMYLMGNILFPNTSCSVLNWLIDYVDDLLALVYYAWAQATQKWLMEDVPQMAAWV